MAHKKSSNPTTGSDPAGVYGTDYNKLIDHLERNTSITDPFTFNVEEHTFKSTTGNAAGDLWVGNGTKMSKMAKGTALQQIRVKSDGSGLEYFTPSAGAGDVTGAANVGSGTGMIFRDEVTGVLNLKSLLAGSNVTITNNANDITIASSGGGGGSTVTFFDYIMWKSGATYFSYNVGAATTASGSDFRTLYNAAVSALSSGGSILLRRGTYDVSGGSLSVADNIHTYGEGRGLTIINHLDDTNQCFKRTGTITINWALFNLKVQSAGHKSPIYLAGGTRCTLQNCHFQFTSMPPAPEIMVWFDSVSSTRDNYYNAINNNVFEGATNGQDSFGCGHLDHSSVSFNRFIGPSGATGAGQAMGIASTRYSTFIGNVMSNYSNSIGFEGSTGQRGCIGNTVVGNIQWNCGKIKLSQEGTDNISKFNVVRGNFLIYGNAGIETGASTGDTIDGNVIVRTTATGIRGTGTAMKITNNLIYDCNHTSASFSLTGPGAKRTGGILLRNNSSFTTPNSNVVENNTIYRSGVAYTYEPDSSSKTGQGGGILVDSTFTDTNVRFNVLRGISTDLYVDAGTNTQTGYNTNIRTEWSGSATIPSGSTSIAVTHTLAITPWIDQINVTLKNNPTVDPGNVWISNVTATQFTINCRTNPSTSGAIFGWNYCHNPQP